MLCLSTAHRTINIGSIVPLNTMVLGSSRESDLHAKGTLIIQFTSVYNLGVIDSFHIIIGIITSLLPLSDTFMPQSRYACVATPLHLLSQRSIVRRVLVVTSEIVAITCTTVLSDSVVMLITDLAVRRAVVGVVMLVVTSSPGLLGGCRMFAVHVGLSLCKDVSN